jgi:broad specificity phosphatase PhoE
VTRLVLCRHAEAGNAAQVAALVQELAALPLAAVYTSPLERALETARAIAVQHGLEPVAVPALREIERGAAEGLAFEAYPAELQAELLTSPESVRFPRGESFDDVRVRVAPAFAEIVAGHAGQTVAAVSHAGAIRAALAVWIEIGGDGAFRIDQAPGAVNVIDWSDGRPFVRLVNGSGIATIAGGA